MLRKSQTKPKPKDTINKPYPEEKDEDIINDTKSNSNGDTINKPYPEAKDEDTINDTKSRIWGHCIVSNRVMYLVAPSKASNDAQWEREFNVEIGILIKYWQTHNEEDSFGTYDSMIDLLTSPEDFILFTREIKKKANTINEEG